MDQKALDAARHALERTADGRLSTLIDGAPDRGVDAAGLVLFGLIGPQIVQAGANVRADLLVLGAHSKRVFGRTYLGSTARYVLETAPCPILFGRPAPGVATHSTAAEAGQLISKD
jgi:nucleotide-binding universal stress UspA family protein